MMKKIYNFLDKLCGRTWFIVVFPFIAIAFLLLYSFTTSPLFLNDGMDSAVFKSMGLAILENKIPYVDIFDHKGPILYLINALGQWIIPGRIGIFCLQTIGLTIGLIFLYKTARLFVGNLEAFISVLISLYILGGIIDEGNQCEEWMMYMFTIAIYFSLKYFTQQSNNISHPWYYSLIYGLCFGITFFIRPNDSVAQIGGIMTGITLFSIHNKHYYSAIHNIVAFICGFCIVLIPVLCYFAYHHAITDLWYGLIGFNQEYSGGMIHLVSSIVSTKKIVLFLFFSIAILAYYSPYKKTLFVLIPFFCFYMVLLGASFYLHYYIVFTPIFLLIIVLLLAQKKRSIILLSVAIFCFSFMMNTNLINISYRSLYNRFQLIIHGQSNVAQFYDETDSLYKLIPDEERKSVWNYNLKWTGGEPTSTSNFSTLWHNGIVQCNLITYATNDFLRQKDDVTIAHPKWVVLEKNNPEEIDGDSILNALYLPVKCADTTICNMELWHLKE